MLYTPFEEDIPGAICHDYCFFIRHGETHWNSERRTMGWLDIPLSKKGIHQAYEAQKSIKALNIQTICSSPLQRALHTAKILNEGLKIPLIELDDLKELGWGEQEGQIRTVKSEHMLRESKQGIRPDNAEPLEAFERRALRGLKASLTHPGPVLIVSHGGVFWALATYFNWSIDKIISNCDIIQVFFPRVHGEWLLRKIN